MTMKFSFDDTGLYLWPPDYPARNYWASANTGSAAEHIAINAPVAGYYWLEVYGYSSSFYDLVVGGGVSGALSSAAPASNPPRTTRTGLVTEPSHLYRLTARFDRIYLPLVLRGR